MVIYQQAGRTAVTFLVPKILEGLIKYFTPVTNLDTKRTRIQLKTRDTFVFTQWHYDQIIQAQKDWFEIRLAEKKSSIDMPMKQLAKNLNIRFGVNKCYSVYSKIFAGKAKRCDFPPGDAIFPDENPKDSK